MTTEASNCSCHDLDLLHLFSQSQLEPELRRVKAGELVWDSAIGDGKVIIVKEGSVRVYQNSSDARPRLAHVIGAGHWVGVDSLAGVRGNTKVIAADAGVIAVVEANQVLELATADPKFARELIKHLATQVVSLSDEITDLRTQDCTQQVVHALLRLSRCGGANASPDGNRVTLQITQQDVADAVGIARETVNAMIQKLAEAGAIQKQRGRISFDPAVLARTAQEASRVAGTN